jgi:BppU N-terminal domain
MAGTFKMKRYDRLPPLDVQLVSDVGPVDLTSATSVKFLMRNADKVMVINNTMQVINASQGMVRYLWADGDTDVIGSFKAEIEVIWPGSLPQTFPAASYFRVKIYEDINAGPA